MTMLLDNRAEPHNKVAEILESAVHFYDVGIEIIRVINLCSTRIPIATQVNLN